MNLNKSLWFLRKSKLSNKMSHKSLILKINLTKSLQILIMKHFLCHQSPLSSAKKDKMKRSLTRKPRKRVPKMCMESLIKCLRLKNLKKINNMSSQKQHKMPDSKCKVINK